MELFVRAAGPADAEEIAEVQRISWHAAYEGMLTPESLARVAHVWGPAHWRASLERIDDCAFPLVLDGRATGVVGFGVAGPRRGRSDGKLAPYGGEIYLLYLLPAAQRQGHGRRLTAALARVLLARGMRAAVVWALARNKPAITFYRRTGAAVLGEARRPFFGQMVDETALGWENLAALAGMSPEARE